MDVAQPFIIFCLHRGGVRARSNPEFEQVKSKNPVRYAYDRWALTVSCLQKTLLWERILHRDVLKTGETPSRGGVRRDRNRDLECPCESKMEESKHRGRGRVASYLSKQQETLS